jgi:hypothetical protein
VTGDRYKSLGELVSLCREWLPQFSWDQAKSGKTIIRRAELITSKSFNLFKMKTKLLLRKEMDDSTRNE